MNKKLVVLVCFLVSIQSAFAQFEKKLTFDFSVGYALPLGDALQEDRLPFFFSNLNSGIAILSDAQYNINPHLSVGLQGEYTRFFSWADPRFGSNQTEDNSKINLINLNPFVRYRILKGKLSPFMIGSIGATFYNGERERVEITLNDFFLANPQDSYVSIEQVVLREPGQSLSNTFTPNVFVGGGIDYNLTASMGLFLNVTYNTVFTKNDEVLRQNLSYPLFSIGVNANFVKSKTL
jgi:opacity protein-like surface antigen